MKLEARDARRELKVQWCRTCDKKTIHFACLFFRVDEASDGLPEKVYCCCGCNNVRLGHVSIELPATFASEHWDET